MSTLSFAQIEKLWTDNGGSPNLAPLMASISLAESGGRTEVVNDNPRTGDYSVGLWQINYLGKLGPARSAQYGTPDQLIADPNRQAKAAISLAGNGAGLSNWTTYSHGAYKPFLASQGSTLPNIPALPTLGARTATGGSQTTGGADDEGYLIDLTMPSKIPNIRVSRAAVRKVLGATVLVAGAATGLAGAFLLAGKRAPGPGGVIQAAKDVRADRERGRDEEAMVTSKAEGRRRDATEKAEKQRSAANRAEARRAVAERQQQNRTRQRQEDALQRIEARRTSSAADRRTTGRGGTAPGRGAQSRSRSARAAGERAAADAGPF